MLCPKHGSTSIDPHCPCCVGEDAKRECAEFVAHLRRLKALCEACGFAFGEHAKGCPISGAGQAPSAHHGGK